MCYFLNHYDHPCMQKFLQSRVNENVSLKSDFQPQFFRLSQPQQEQELAHLLAHHPHIQVFDQLQSQLEELVKSLNPSTAFTNETLQEAVKLHLGHTNPAQYGVWVYYPWSARLVHIVDEQEFIFLRTSRNQYKITSEERDLLATKKVGVVGLSVGQSVAVTMAMERLFGEIRLADFDTLELTNLNRIRTGIHNLGLPKVTSVAREIMEIDPFLKVICYTDGLTEKNMDDFFTKGGKLDVLVEECDGIDIKILCRHKARELQVTVVMETSDRGMLDVERFDLEPKRKILHGLIDHLDIEKLKTLKTSEEKLPYMLPVVGFETISNRLKASALEVGQSITTWPQLASAVTFGGGLTADVVRRILLDEYKSSGRYYVDMEELVGDAPKAQGSGENKALTEALTPQQMQRIASSLSIAPAVGLTLSEDTILELVTAANLAPSLGNSQPWKWLYQNNRLFLFLDRSRSQSFWDIDDVFGYVGLGAALENLILKTRQKGWDLRIAHFPKQQYPELAAVISFIESDDISTEPSSALDSRLAETIAVRMSNTSMGIRSALTAEKLTELQKALLGIPGVKLQLLDNPDDLTEVAEIVAASERLRFLHPEGHREFFQRYLRWNRTEADARGDGLLLENFHPADRLLLQFIKKPEVVGFLHKWNKGKRLGYSAKHTVRHSSAVGLLTIQGNVKGNVRDAYLRSGQALQRTWLAASAHSIMLQPIQAPLYVFNRYIAQPSSLSSSMRQELAELLPRFTKVFNLTDKLQPIFLFHLTPADKIKALSPRRPARDTVTMAAEIYMEA